MFHTAINQNYQSNLKGNKLFRVVAKRFPHFAVSARLVSLSLFLFLLGRGFGAETFFSVYIFEVTGLMGRVSIILLIAVVARALLILPIANLEQEHNIRKILIAGKIMYALCGLLYFVAGMTHQVPLLVVAALLNAVGADAIYTSYQTYLRLHTTYEEKTRAFGLFFSSFNGALVVGGVASAFLVEFIPLPYMYLLVCVFSLLSLVLDRKFEQATLKKWVKEKRFFWNMLKSVFHKQTYHKVFSFYKKYAQYLTFPLMLWLIWSILNYVSYFFVPLLGYQRELSLPEVAIVFVVMRLPYLVSFAVPEIKSNFVKKNVVLGVYLLLALLFIGLYFVASFQWIVVLSLGVSLALAFAGPLIVSSFSRSIPKKDMWNLTWFQEFFARLGEIFAMGFLAIVSFLFGLPVVFLWAGIGVIVFSVGFGVYRLLRGKRKEQR